MNAEIISIGDELLIGQVINTNQAFIAQQLNSVGVSVQSMITVGDTENEILSAFEKTWRDTQVIIVTGGLGPTHDDITRQVVCRFFDDALVMNIDALKNIERIVQGRNLRMRHEIEEQALVPMNAEIIHNAIGTAPGILYRKEGKYFFVLPGVPREMEFMMTNFIIPLLREKNSGAVILHRTLKTVGIAESYLALTLGNIETLHNHHPTTTLAFLPQIFSVRLRITVREKNLLQADEQIQRVEHNIREKINNYIYGADDEELEEIVGKILAQKNRTIAVAESCTGGRIADKITNVSGSSSYFFNGVVAYSNAMKISLLNVDENLIKQFGAVSKEVAEAMASGVRQISSASIGISTTGIAGPTGGSKEKPVGLVYLGYSTAEETFAIQYFLGEGRKEIKERASLAALELVRRKLSGIPLQ
ncbi:MAG: competence/damage-inducible protein A [Bacteroidota bacterium]